MEKREVRKRESMEAQRHFLIFDFCFLFFFSGFFLKIICVYGVYVGRPPGDGIHLSIGNARNRRERTAQILVLSVFWPFFLFFGLSWEVINGTRQETGRRKVCLHSRFSLFYLFFDLVAAGLELMNYKEATKEETDPIENKRHWPWPVA